MIHEAYMPVYRCPDFHCVVRTGSPEVVQEALADLKSKVLFRNTLYHIVWFHYDSWMKAILSRTSQGFCIHGRTIFSKKRCREMLCGNFRSMRPAKTTNKPPPNIWNRNCCTRKSWSFILLSCWDITFRLPESPPWETLSPRFSYPIIVQYFRIVSHGPCP